MGGIIDQIDSMIDRHNDDLHRLAKVDEYIEHCNKAVYQVLRWGTMPGFRFADVAREKAEQLARTVKADLENIRAEVHRVAAEQQRIEQENRWRLEQAQARIQQLEIKLAVRDRRIRALEGELLRLRYSPRRTERRFFRWFWS